MKRLLLLFGIVWIVSLALASEESPPPPEIRDTPDFEEVYDLREDLKKRILGALGSDYIQEIYSIETLHTGKFDVVYLYLRVASTRSDPRHWEGLCLARKRRGEKEWQNAEVYNPEEPIRWKEMVSASEDEWERLLEERCRSLQ